MENTNRKRRARPPAAAAAPPEGGANTRRRGRRRTAYLRPNTTTPPPPPPPHHHRHRQEPYGGKENRTAATRIGAGARTQTDAIRRPQSVRVNRARSPRVVLVRVQYPRSGSASRRAIADVCFSCAIVAFYPYLRACACVLCVLLYPWAFFHTPPSSPVRRFLFFYRSDSRTLYTKSAYFHTYQPAVKLNRTAYQSPRICGRRKRKFFFTDNLVRWYTSQRVPSRIVNYIRIRAEFIGSI